MRTRPTAFGWINLEVSVAPHWDRAQVQRLARHLGYLIVWASEDSVIPLVDQVRAADVDVVVIPGYSDVLPDTADTSAVFAADITLAVPLVSCTIGKARCLCSFFQKLHSPLFGGQSRSRSRPCAEKGEKGEQRKGKGKAKQNTKYDSRTASRAWLEKENGTCIVMKCVSYSVYPYLQMLWKLTMDSALFLTTTKLKPPISYWT